MLRRAAAGLAVFMLVVYSHVGCTALAIDGSGNVVEEPRTVPRFHGIDLTGIADVVIRQGAAQEVVVEADDNIVPHVTTEVREGILRISNDTDIKRATTLILHVTMEEVRQLSISGAGDMVGSDGVSAHDLDLHLSGAGSVKMEVHAQRIGATISGAGDVSLSGETESLDVAISGAGELSAFGLLAKVAEVSISGAGDCEVNVLETLEASVSGAGDVRYKGNPEVLSTVSGVGAVSASD